jgi:WD40 repeat protein
MEQQVRCYALSPDGRWAAVSDTSGKFKLWDLGLTPVKGKAK